MQILDLSHNDDLRGVIQKCNVNFKELAYATKQSLRRQGRQIDDNIDTSINDAVTMLITTSIPNEVTSQLGALDIPGQVSSAVASQISLADIPGQVATAINDANIPTLVANEVAAQIGSDSTSTISDFITIDTNDVVVVSGIAHKWGKIAKISLTYRFKNPYVVMSDGKINNLQLGTLTSDWMTVGGLTNVSLDTTHQIEGVIDNDGLIAFMSANSRGTSYTIDENTVLYAGFTYILA